MKKLQIKVSLVIFLLLTSFTTIIFTTSMIRSYIERKDAVSAVLTRAYNNFDDKKNPKPKSSKKPDDLRRIYMDFMIYTIALDEDGNYDELIDIISNYDIEEEYIRKTADWVIANHSSDMYVGNLYRNQYSYVFTNNTLVIVDNAQINSDLNRQLLSNISLFILTEMAIGILTYFITAWIITPVKESFEKQKAFVADASHELKTPLAVMIASSDAYFNDKNDKWVKNMKSEAERMTKLVTELLDLAKTEEEQDIVMENNNLSNIVESSILTFESLFYENDISLKYDINKDIYLVCNFDLITQLMGILIDNAIKHSSKKGKVSVNLIKKNKQIVLEVKNKGLPIKKGEEEKIFERFYKADESRNRNSNNYGLGLAIAKNIVLKHSGVISAHSSNGYTTFKVIWNQK